ncbi:cell wall adhesin EAP1-like [Pyrus communis]|uniref:cell wall adhesin EAP1-like n=1 Tax=Pyrus communis TaxID=23211 RepID=UPI0035C0DFC7
MYTATNDSGKGPNLFGLIMLARGRVSRKVEAVATVVRAKKLVPTKRTIATEQTVPSKRRHREAEPEDDDLRPSKRVKKLAKKGDREIHVVPSDTTRTTAPAGSPFVSAAPASTNPIPSAVSLPEATADPAVVSAPASEPVMAPAVRETAAPVEAPSIQRPTVFLKEDVESENDEVPLERRPRPANSPPVHPHLVVEAAAQLHPPTADRGKRPLADPEATAETPLHPQDEDLPIPPQEVSSAFPLWEVELDALLQSTTGEAGSSAASAEPAGTMPEAQAFVKLHEVLSLSASQAEDDLKEAKVAQEAGRAEIEAIKGKKAKLTEFDRQISDLQRQISDLQRQRSAAASELEKDFEANRARLTAFAAGARHIQQLQFNKKTRRP